MPREYVRQVFKDKGYTYADFERTEEFMELVRENWQDVDFIRKPKPWEKEDDEEEYDLSKILREKDIEEYLRKRVKEAGGKAYKFESPGNDGVPDRLVIFPGNNIYFVELKAPGKKPRPLQLKQIRDISSFGCEVLVIDSKDGVEDFIQEARGANG